jgi:hypothetical protein
MGDEGRFPSTCTISSGSLAMFAAIRRASSRVSSLAADRRPFSSQAIAFGSGQPETGGT